ncbi:hypothetical protein H4687_008875 [Streptomyces stelliscabiei]|uniref:Uncharacterized protein n=1 Tax=Streptomyces stelliscabiei TaxID=146820 RepID=A0A8I0PHP9_9ACTN|nr:hypothetical protein [Streptomyces stelliscabiei]
MTQIRGPRQAQDVRGLLQLFRMHGVASRGHVNSPRVKWPRHEVIAEIRPPSAMHCRAVQGLVRRHVEPRQIERGEVSRPLVLRPGRPAPTQGKPVLHPLVREGGPRPPLLVRDGRDRMTVPAAQGDAGVCVRPRHSPPSDAPLGDGVTAAEIARDRAGVGVAPRVVSGASLPGRSVRRTRARCVVGRWKVRPCRWGCASRTSIRWDRPLVSFSLSPPGVTGRWESWRGTGARSCSLGGGLA